MYSLSGSCILESWFAYLPVIIASQVENLSKFHSSYNQYIKKRAFGLRQIFLQ